ncbi:MAG: hypothetical protein ABS46_03945 [Cytophagaceae bacterium SCN 52-12]|nr:MAG: hypothetical protein ABS46_03945 [Cytophagaceae bacterium SCN 52-12]
MKAILLPVIFLTGICACFISCTKEEIVEQVVVAPSEATLVLDARVGNEDFSLNRDFTIGGITYNFEKLRYWISNIVLVNENGTEYAVPDSYFLMEEVGNLDLTGTISDRNIVYPANKREEVVLAKIPEGNYNTLRFSVGVDQKHNDNLSLQPGELSISNGMSNISWMWHTSYIFSSIGGKAGANAKKFVAETGLNDNYKTVTVALSSPLKAEAGASPRVIVNLDVAKVLEGIDPVTNPTIGAGQPEAMKTIADNFSQKAFGFASVQ